MIKNEVTRTRRRGALSADEVERSRAEHGANLLPRAKKIGFWRKFLSNMGDPVIKILLVALAVNVIFTFRDANPIESIGIAASILLATLISTLSEQGSENAFEKLEAESRNEKCRVRRIDEEGKAAVLALPFSEVVVGDVVLLSAGDRIAADGVLISGRLAVDQSGLNGESREAEKRAGEPFKADLSATASVFGGCTVLSGEGEMEVLRVGKESFLGGISREIQTETRQSPLKLRLGKLARQISIFGYIAAALCAVAYLASALLIDPPAAIDTRLVLTELLAAFTLGLTVVVMAVPEGLPMMIAVVLSSNIKRMVRDQVLVRKPVGIEAAGSMNILFTDKTGTLTEGKMKVGGIICADGSKLAPKNLSKSAPAIAELYKLFAHFGESEISNGQVVGGNATERAIAESAAHLGSPNGFKLSDRLPFDSARKFSAARLIGKKSLTLVKGAPEVLLPHITKAILPDGREIAVSPSELTSTLLSPAQSGWRVLALCLSSSPISSRGELSDLSLVCAVLIADRVRPEAPCSVDELKRAGIQVVMITGDNRATAVSVAEKCGIYRSGDLCLTSDELALMSDGQIKSALARLRVVARALPSDKSRLVRLAQELGLVVGMTGDGVNDAPALKAADIGFAMGSGTSVAKEAGDIIILDDNLASVVKAVLYGRNIFKSIRKFIVLQLTINLCAAGVTMIGPFIAIESPVTVVQMLWINIIMDTLGGIAFAGEPALPFCMREKPKTRDESILNRYMVNQIACLGASTVALCVFFLKSAWVTSRFEGGEGGLAHLTAFFAFFIFAGVFNCFNARTDSLNLFRGLSGNRTFILVMAAVTAIQIAFVYLGGSVLRTVPLSAADLGFTMAFATLVFPLEFIRKIVWRLSGERGGF